MRYQRPLVTIGSVLLAAHASAQEYETNFGTFLNFESPQVHPIAFSATGTRLFVCDTPDARLSVFDTSVLSNPVLLAEIPVGIEPVTVRPRTADEVWVVNHTSDSISVVSLTSGIVTDTIQCKDEPCDVVFAGSPTRAYVSIAGSKQVRVFDVTTHAPVATIAVPGMQPRALAVNASGTRVFAVVAISGNRTTILPANVAPPQPPSNNATVGAPPHTGMIVDSTNPQWSTSIPYTVSDHDVIEVDTATNTIVRTIDGVGTVNFNIAVRPGTGDLYVPCTEARNTVRYENDLRGHAVDNLLTRIDVVSGAVTRFDLNAGFNYANPNNPAAKAIALAQPVDAVFTPSGALYVTAFGTDRIARIDPTNGAVLARIEVGNAPGALVDSRHKRGPRGMAVHPSGNRLFVLNRIANTITIVNPATDTVLSEIPVGAFDPTPLAIKEGRGFLYDAKLSGNGTMSCAACHIDGETDREDWDLGNYEDPEIELPDPSNTYGLIGMHPMKGPMFTQTLRGLSQGSNPLHWRGDRSDFNSFNVAFSALMGGSQIPAADMQAFTDFVMTCEFEPNPNLLVDRSMPATLNGGNTANGLLMFTTGSASTPLGSCNSCHHLPLGTGSKIINATVLGQLQGLKVPQLRTAYMKTDFNNAPGAVSIAGFGLAHDGAAASVEAFLSNPVTFGTLATDATAKRDLAAFVACIDTNTPPGVGWSKTLRSTNVVASAGEIALLLSRADLGEIDVIVKGRVDNQVRGFKYVPMFGTFDSDLASYGPFLWSDLVAKVQAGGVLTVYGVPFGAGQRMGIDRNMNGVPDGNESPTIEPNNPEDPPMRTETPGNSDIKSDTRQCGGWAVPYR